MTEKYSVYQHWDPLKVCLVGKSYSPQFYSFIKNSRVRTVFEQIAQETEEDYQKLIKLLESFGVEVLRPDVSDNYEECLEWNSNKIIPPPMTPRDYSISLGENFFFKCYNELRLEKWNIYKGSDWPETWPNSWEEFLSLPKSIQNDINSQINNIKYHYHLIPTDTNSKKFENRMIYDPWTRPWKNVLKQLYPKFNNLYTGESPECVADFSSAMISRIGKDVYCGTYENSDLNIRMGDRDLNQLTKFFPEYRWHTTETGGHLDGTYCPVVPGLIVSLMDIPTYKDTFPDWEVVYLPNQSWSKVQPFLKLKEKNKGKWWVPGQELNDDFTNFVEEWMGHWVGYVEETVFDVNMLVIDEKNVVCNNYNEEVFRAFDRYGITPHVINFRHRYFWDGGLHCITSDIHREGTMKDYFPERREI